MLKNGAISKWLRSQVLFALLIIIQTMQKARYNTLNIFKETTPCNFVILCI